MQPDVRPAGLPAALAPMVAAVALAALHCMPLARCGDDSVPHRDDPANCARLVERDFYNLDYMEQRLEEWLKGLALRQPAARELSVARALPTLSNGLTDSCHDRRPEGQVRQAAAGEQRMERSGVGSAVAND